MYALAQLESLRTNIAEYRISTEDDVPRTGTMAGYVLSGWIARRERGDYLGRINVKITETGEEQAIERPFTSILDIFEVADELSREVLTFFTDAPITVGTVTISDEHPTGGGNAYLGDVAMDDNGNAIVVWCQESIDNDASSGSTNITDADWDAVMTKTLPGMTGRTA